MSNLLSLIQKYRLSPARHQLEVLERQQHRRRKLVREICNISDSEKARIPLFLDKDVLHHIVVDDKNHLLYCYVPKVACTTWKRLLMITTGLSDVQDYEQINGLDAHRRLRRLSNYSSDEVNHRLKTYMKFMFARHPFERLLSGYNNKFKGIHSEWWQLRYGTEIIKRYRSNPSEESLARGNDATFQVTA